MLETGCHLSPCVTLKARSIGHCEQGAAILCKQALRAKGLNGDMGPSPTPLTLSL